MLKKFLLLAFILLFAPCVLAQEVFWGYDEQGKELIVPPECDSDQKADELYEIGMHLFEETGYARQGASYCLLAAAMDNHPQAQYQVAHMYHKGILLPKSDLAAYKWATLAALNGNEEGDKLGAGIEQFLSIQDIELSTKSLESLLPIITKNTQQKLDDEVKKQALIKQSIKAVNAEVADLKKYGYIRKKTITSNKRAAEDLNNRLNGVASVSDSMMLDDEMLEGEEKTNSVRPAAYKKRASPTERAKANESIYSSRDLDEIPMPSSI